MIIDELFTQDLLNKSLMSERKRTNYDLRTSEYDKSQRMLNALQPGTFVPIHRHSKSSETVVCLLGSLTEIFFDEKGVECMRYEINPKEGRYALQIPLGQWHTVIVHEPSVIFESKDGPYEPLTSEDVWNYE